MLITLCYLYLWARWGACSAELIRRTVHRLYRTRCSFTFCSSSSSGCSSSSSLGCPRLTLDQQPPHLPLCKQEAPRLSEEIICLRVGDKIFFTGETQSLDDLNKWTLLIVSPFSYLEQVFEAEHITFVTEGIFIQASSSQAVTCSAKKIVKCSDFCSPLAFKTGKPYILFAEASIDNFSSLGIAFLEDRLQMDNGMVPQKIVSVDLKKSALEELKLAPSTKEEEKAGQIQTGELSQDSLFENTDKSQVEAADCAGSGDQEMHQEKCRMQKINEHHEELEQLSEKEGDTSEHHHLHLSSCHECLELENSTIESVKFASAENIPDLPDDYSGSVEEVSGDCITGNMQRVNLTGKPPNILIYLGSDSKKVKFEEIKSVIMDCVDINAYTIYQLLEKQVLTVPWVDNAMLLIIAVSEPISEAVSKQFLAFMSKGGKILGLSTSFTFGGVQIKSKNEIMDTIQTLVFSKDKNNEIKLNVLASGKCFEVDVSEELNPVKPLGYFDNPDKDTMVVHLSYGNNGGEAILSQAHLEVNVKSLCRSKDDFNMLKISNARRYDVLVEILKLLGLSCELSTIPSLTPIYLLSSDKVLHNTFLEWLRRNMTAEGLITSSKVSLKFVSSCSENMEITPLLIPVVTEMEALSSEKFSFERYKQNLDTRILGKTVLFSEVTSTTMNLLDGLMYKMPQEMGLIAIAVQQTQGKGRGGNIWLSPVGAALSTLHITIPLSSKLGQRIPFIQHLVSLAVVEAVRSLPGYQDIDLRVKWPNDIYYSDLMKLGGVLVNSTLTGDMFHILIGCGFNVNNSNPTICINDLILEHNKIKNTMLEPLNADCLIARSVSILENLINTFQEEGPNGILPMYYKYWVHSGKQVRLRNDDGPMVWIVGIDDSGFLQVYEEGKDVMTVHPDGNSFDMLRNLIIPKQ
ncbi:biotin--protein ligase [Python bivittatus]|uniref:Biotin--protein ligase n=1 Tax=Python bivittatus TaxID=176946 RepID=A0A9F2KUD1_PYTBI|nr:biotin--protein ligase [Python bivittatus]